MRTITLLGLIAAGPFALPVSAQPPASCEPVDDMRFVCGQRAPEDLVVLPGAEWVVASAYAGAGGLELIRVSDETTSTAYPAANAAEQLDAETYPGCPGPPSADAFTTHGLSVLPGAGPVHRLFVVGHGARESVEVFEIDMRPETPSFSWVGCVVAPDPIGLNSVRGLDDGGFVTTNFLPREGDRSAMGRMMQGELNGELWEWRTNSGWRKVPGSEASGANGVELDDESDTLYMAEWGRQSFARISRGRSPVARDDVELGFRVDNIRWARDGSLLAVGQGTGEESQVWKVVKIDPETLEATDVLSRPDNDVFVAGTVAVEVGEDLWIGSFRGDRIAIVPAP